MKMEEKLVKKNNNNKKNASQQFIGLSQWCILEIGVVLLKEKKIMMLFAGSLYSNIIVQTVVCWSAGRK